MKTSSSPQKLLGKLALGFFLLGLIALAGSLGSFVHRTRSTARVAPATFSEQARTQNEIGQHQNLSLATASPAAPNRSQSPEKAKVGSAAPLATAGGPEDSSGTTSLSDLDERPSGPGREREGAESRLKEMKAPIPEGDAGEEGGRQAWFYEQRAYPLQTIPRAARAQAIRQLEQLENDGGRLNRLGVEAAGGALEPNAQVAWTALGPAPIGVGSTFGPGNVPTSGRVSAIALAPGYNGSTNQTVYVGGAQGGVWRSQDNGANWTPLIDDQPSLAVGALAIDPTNPNIIYVGTGEGNQSGDSYYGAGLLKSLDGGVTWTQITGPVSPTGLQVPAFLNASFLKIVIDPTTPSTVYLCTYTGSTSGASGGSGRSSVPAGNHGVWKSIDGGANWRNLNPSNSDIDRSATDLVLDPQNPQRVLAALLSQGIFRSTTGGEPGSWEKLAGSLPTTGFTRIALATGPPLAPSTSATVYAALAANDANGSLVGIFKSTDFGTTWTKVTTPSNSGQNDYNLALAVDPVDANLVYFCTSANRAYTDGAVQRSRDGGTTWTAISRGNGSGGLHPDSHAIVISPTNRNTVFTGNDGGIWRTDNATDQAVGWTSLNRTLNITQFQGVALHPTDPNILLGGTQDNGTNRYNGSSTWFNSDSGDGGFALIDQSNPQVMYHTYFNENNSGGTRAQIGPVISFDGGNSWNNVRGCFGCAAQPGNINPSDRVGFYAPMALHPGINDPTTGNVIYFGTHRLYRSSDQGLTWTGLGASTDGFGADLTKNLSGFNSRLSAIAAHPRLDGNTTPPGEVVWVGTNDGLVQVTTNAGLLAGATFTNVTKAPLPNRFVTDIALDPANQQRAFVTYSGFNTNTPEAPGHVFATADQGATWTNISGDLPDVPVTSIALNPVRANTLYIGTDIGVFQTTDGGGTWVRLSNGMPKVATFMVRYHAASGSLIAATHGRGMYRLALNRTASVVSAASFSGATLAREAIVASFGTGLATSIQAATSIPLPTTLVGTRVVVRDSAGVERLAPLFFVSAGQINYQIPPGTANGTATVIITSGDGTVSVGAVTITPVAPSLFSANSDGQGAAAAYAVRVKADGTQVTESVLQFDGTKFVPRPIDLGPAGESVFVILYGTGIRNRSALSGVSARVGGVEARADYAGPAPGFVGLDQLNVLIPRSLVGRLETDIAVVVDGKAANAVRVSIK